MNSTQRCLFIKTKYTMHLIQSRAVNSLQAYITCTCIGVRFQGVSTSFN